MSEVTDVFRVALMGAGIPISGEIVADGTLHRYKTEGDHQENCWYVLFQDEPVNGSYGCFKRQIKVNWHLRNGEARVVSKEENAELRRRWREAEVLRAAEEANRHERVSAAVTARATRLSRAVYSHDYLRAKGVTTYGNLLEDEDGKLFLPLQDVAGKIWSCQRIYADGTKRYAAGGRISGCFYWLADRTDGPLILCEGYSTGASIHQATGWAVACAMDSGNLLPVAKALRESYPDRSLLIAADNDNWDKKTGEMRKDAEGNTLNPGLDAAIIAAKAVKAVLVVPEFPDTDRISTDFNDLAGVSGLEQVRTLFEQAVPCPLSILSFDQISLIPVSESDRLLGDNMLNRGGNMTILGQGGVGKSRLVFQMIAAAVTGLPKFLTWDIHPGARNFRWLVLQQENSVRRLQSTRESLKASMNTLHWLKFNELVRVLTPLNEIDCFLNLDNPENVLRIQKSIDHHLPDGLIFDSLYDFSSGDLNKDADMRATLTAISRLARYRNPKRPVIVLHHASPGQSGASKAIGFDRAIFARNSKVIQFWSRCQVNITPMSEDDNSRLAVSCGKLSDGREFPPFAVHLDNDTMLYGIDPEVDVAEWSKEMRLGKKSPEMTDNDVMMLTDPGISKVKLARKIMDEIGCVRTSAYRYISRALAKRKIRESNGCFFKA